MTPFRNVPPSSTPQLYSDALHLTGAIIVTLCATFLAYTGKIPADITGAVYTGVIGYVAGRAGNVARTLPSRAGDSPEPPSSPSDLADPPQGAGT